MKKIKIKRITESNQDKCDNMANYLLYVANKMKILEKGDYIYCFIVIKDDIEIVTTRSKHQIAPQEILGLLYTEIEYMKKNEMNAPLKKGNPLR